MNCFSSRRRKKIDYFLPASFSKCQKEICPVLPLDVIMRGMSQGTVMYKVKGPDKWFKRKYVVDVQKQRLTYHPSDKPFWREKITTIDLYEVQEVRKGWNSDVFNAVEAKFRRQIHASLHPQLKALLQENNCFSLVVGPSKKIIDLIAPNHHTRDAWVRGLNHLLASCKSSQKKIEFTRWLKEQARKADIDRNGVLNFNECLTLLKQLNISMDRKDVKKLFDAANIRKSKIDGEDALDPEEFVEFYFSLTKRPEIEELMKEYSVSKTAIFSAEELQHFLEKAQKVHVTIEVCRSLIEQHEADNIAEKIPGFLSAKGLENILLTPEYNIFNIKHKIIYQDMKQPLNHYFIASSHNTYLVAGQLIGASSVEGYIQALIQNCRCLELDTWDGPDGEPIIFHGYTLTSRIFLRDVLEAIKEYAFRSSQYPVILSLENHCSPPYQLKMAEHFVNILGDYLHQEHLGEDGVEFPSPEDLARKILLKGKKLTTVGSFNLQFAFEVEDEERLDEVMQQHQIMQLQSQQHEMGKVLSQADVPPDQQLDETNTGINSEVFLAPVISIQAPRHNVHRKLSELVTCSAVRFESFPDSANWKFWEMASFQETKALKLIADNGNEFVTYNKKHLSRIYPKGSRTDSSNYDPIPFWNVGCQLVALNYQTKDESMYLHKAKFAPNGECGYILKPRFLYDKEISYCPHAIPDPKYERHMLIKIISGQKLPKPYRATEGEVVDPYVVLKVFGHPIDVQKKKTYYISNNGFNPVWNDAFLVCLRVPELAILKFIVKDQSLAGKNEVLGQYSIPFTSIAEGYRHIHLDDAKGEPLIAASLFVHITIDKEKNDHQLVSQRKTKTYSIS